MTLYCSQLKIGMEFFSADLGIVRVEETKKKKVPSVAYDRIAFEVAI
jgi:predicted transcriptional regulator